MLENHRVGIFGEIQYNLSTMKQNILNIEDSLASIVWNRDGTTIAPLNRFDTVYSYGGFESYKISADVNGAIVATKKARGTYDVPAAVNVGDYFGDYVGYAHDGTSLVRSASMRFKTRVAIAGTSIPSLIELWASNTATPSVELLLVTFSGALSTTFETSVHSKAQITSDSYITADSYIATLQNMTTTPTEGIYSTPDALASNAIQERMSPWIATYGNVWDEIAGANRRTAFIIQTLPVHHGAAIGTAIWQLGYKYDTAAIYYPLQIYSEGKVVWNSGALASGYLQSFYNNSDLKMAIRYDGSLSFPASAGIVIGITSSEKMAFWGGTPSAQRDLGAYTSDAESSAYTGIASGLGGTPYASLADLNALRTAYDNMRAAFDLMRAASLAIGLYGGS